ETVGGVFGSTTSLTGADTEVENPVAPSYRAVIEWVPTVSEVVLTDACKTPPTAVSGAVPRIDAPLRKVTVPVGVPLAAETVAVNVTVRPSVVGFGSAASAVVVGPNAVANASVDRALSPPRSLAVTT